MLARTAVGKCVMHAYTSEIKFIYRYQGLSTPRSLIISRQTNEDDACANCVFAFVLWQASSFRLISLYSFAILRYSARDTVSMFQFISFPGDDRCHYFL